MTFSVKLVSILAIDFREEDILSFLYWHIRETGFKWPAQICVCSLLPCGHLLGKG